MKTVASREKHARLFICWEIVKSERAVHPFSILPRLARSLKSRVKLSESRGRKALAPTSATVHPFLPVSPLGAKFSAAVRPISFCSTAAYAADEEGRRPITHFLKYALVRSLPIPNTHLGEVEVESVAAEIEACTYWIGGDTRMCEARAREEGGWEGGREGSKSSWQ